MTLFTFVYYFAVLILYIVLLPYLIYLSFKNKYKEAIPARFFLWNNPPFEKSCIWFHACSFGEMKSLKPLIDRLSECINLTTTTNTGFKEGKNLSKNTKYLPFEIFLPFWINKQKVLVVTEAELWYMLFFIAKKRGMKTILINARISDSSYKNYYRFKFFYKRLFQNIDVVFAQSQKDKKRLEYLGAKKVIVNGNIKAFQKIEVTEKLIKPNKPLVTLASTHEGEEDLILNSLNVENIKIAVVPRHPERFNKVDIYLNSYAKERNLTYSKFSESKNFESDITLVDKMGELINIYAISDFVILGGSFIDGIGGHNPIEPAYFGCKVLSGKYIFNQKALFEIVENIELVEVDELNDYIGNKRGLKNSNITLKGEIEPIISEINSGKSL